MWRCLQEFKQSRCHFIAWFYYKIALISHLEITYYRVCCKNSPDPNLYLLLTQKLKLSHFLPEVKLKQTCVMSCALTDWPTFSLTLFFTFFFCKKKIHFREWAKHSGNWCKSMHDITAACSKLTFGRKCDLTAVANTLITEHSNWMSFTRILTRFLFNQSKIKLDLDFSCKVGSRVAQFSPVHKVLLGSHCSHEVQSCYISCVERMRVWF